jgi:hypothetical protein
MADEPPAMSIDIQVPESLQDGVFADFLSVWHSTHDFTLDFAVTDQPRPTGDGSFTTTCCGRWPTTSPASRTWPAPSANPVMGFLTRILPATPSERIGVRANRAPKAVTVG